VGTCRSLAVASAWCGFLASAAFLLKDRGDAIFCKVSRKKATHLQKSRSKMVESKETIDQNENKLIGATSLPPIVDRFYGPLSQFAVRLTRSESDAADLVQQTFFKLIQHLHRIRDHSRIKCWLFTTLRRNFLMEVRQRAKRREVEFLPDVHGWQTEDLSHWSTLDALTIRRALLQVDESYQTALELFYVNNFSYREIGKALEIPIGTVMSRLSRGKAQLKSILLRYIYGDG
jgi:RNA polymerase sigma-70 factor (ECF subfamily)